jgi:hypothetical protein
VDDQDAGRILEGENEQVGDADVMPRSTRSDGYQPLDVEPASPLILVSVSYG